MKRRDFLRGVVGAAALASFPHHLYAADKEKKAGDRVKLGPKQIEVSRLAMGTGSNGWNYSSNQTRKLGLGGLAALLQAGYDNGVTFYDSADMYGSHHHIREALKKVPRDKVVILTKTRATNAKDMKADLDRFRQELGTDYIDILLLHNQQAPDWNVKQRPVMDVISEAQEKGIVRTKGVSCHSIGALRTAAKEPWVEVDLARLNPAQVQMDDKPEVVISVLKEMKAAGKGVIGMKVFGCGPLLDRKDEMLQYALAQEVLDCFTIGIEGRDQLDDLIKRIPPASTRG